MQKPTELLDIKVVEVIPTHVAQRCPTCSGWTTVAGGSKTCGTCEGKGYILIPAVEGRSYTMPARQGGFR